MTGYWVQVQRDGFWQTVELDELTPEEWAAYAARQSPEQGWHWAQFLATWIRTHVDDRGAGHYRRRRS